jgi:tetratricopeptide (TPR) repeat protein
MFDKENSTNKSEINGNDNTNIQVIGDNNIINNTNDNTPKLTSNTPDLGGVAVVGRKEIIEEIHEKFNNNHILVLYGQGGIGKTICSKYYANEHKNDYNLIRYMTFSSDVKTTLVNGCKLEDFEKHSFDEQFSAVKHYLEGLSEKTLLMIDINEGVPADLENLPQNSNIKILFTTRKKEIISAEEIQISNLNYTDLEKVFINNSVEIKENDKEYLKDIIENILKSNTMVIALAAKVKMKARLTMKDLHDTLNNDRLATQIRENINHENKMNKITEHILKLFSVAELSQEEQEILRYMSLIDYGGVAINKFKEWAELEDYNVLDDLIKGGWINSSNKGDDEIIFMHPVISDAVFEQTKPNSENCKKILSGIYGEYNWGNLYKKIYLFKICEFIIKRIDKKTTKEIYYIYYILNNLYNIFCKYDKAFAGYCELLEDSKRLFGEESANTAQIYNCIGGIYFYFGKFDDALDCYFKTLKIRKKVFNRWHEKLLQAYNNVAGVYCTKGEYTKTKIYLESTFKIIENTENKNRIYIAYAANYYNIIGRLSNKIGKYSEALKYHFESLNIRKEIFEEYHPNTASSYNNIGFVYSNMGEYDKAEEYNFRALNIREKIFGKAHLDTMISYNSIGIMYCKMGEYNKALDYYFKALENYKKVFGKETSNIKIIYKNIAECYEKIGDIKNSEQYRQLAEGAEEHLDLTDLIK